MRSVVMTLLSLMIWVICVFFLFLLGSLVRGLLILSFKRTSFWTHWFPVLISYFNFIDFCSNFLLFLSLTLNLNCSCFSSFLWWKFRWLISDVYSFTVHAYFILSSLCSVTKSCPTLCHPMNRSMPGFPVLHYLLEFAHTHAHGDAVQLSYPLPHIVFSG